MSQAVLKSGADDEAVTAVATNNLVAVRLEAEGGDAPAKALCAELLRKLEALFDKVDAQPRPHVSVSTGAVCTSVEPWRPSYHRVSGAFPNMTGVPAPAQGQEVRLRASLQRRLGPGQQEALAANYALLLLLAGRAEAARDFADATLARCLLLRMRLPCPPQKH